MHLNYQYAHNSHEESEDKEISEAGDALHAFDEFCWDHEAKKANELQKCAPTLTLVLKPNVHQIWVSAWGGNRVEGFVSECHFPGVVPIFLGLGKRNGIVNLHTNNFNTKEARMAIELFIKEDYEKLKELYETA